MDRNWIPCSEKLPSTHNVNLWEEYEVTILGSDFDGNPYSMKFVTGALFDEDQKMWHICRSKESINALLKKEDHTGHGDVVIAWKYRSEPYE